MSVAEDIRSTPITKPANAELRHPKMLIDGAWVDSVSGATLTIENPAKRLLMEQPIDMMVERIDVTTDVDNRRGLWAERTSSASARRRGGGTQIILTSSWRRRHRFAKVRNSAWNIPSSVVPASTCRASVSAA